MKIRTFFVSFLLIAPSVFVMPSVTRYHRSGLLLQYNEMVVNTNNESVVEVDVTDEITKIPVTTHHVVVEYKSAFHGWYLPITDTSSDKQYFYVVEFKQNQSWRVVIRFKDNVSNHLKVLVFPSEGNIGTRLSSYLGKKTCELSLWIKELIAGVFHKDEPMVS